MNSAQMYPVGERVRMMTREINTALGRRNADLVLRRCLVVNPYSADVHRADVAILGRRIVAVREEFDGPTAREQDCDGLLAVPGFIEPQLLPIHGSDWAGVGWDAVRTGTTTLVTPELGPADGIAKYDLPCRLFEATSHGLAQRSGPSSDSAETSVRTTAAMHGLGMARGAATTVLPALRMGRTVAVTDTATEGGRGLLAAIAAGTLDARHLCLGSGSGQVLPEVARALKAGIPAPVILQLASLNAATHYGLDHLLGSIAPGRWADIVLMEKLDAAYPAQVYVGGVLVAEDGRQP